MAAKNGSTKYTAPAVVEEVSGWQPSQPPVSEERPDSARSEQDVKHQSAPERLCTPAMRPRGTSRSARAATLS